MLVYEGLKSEFIEDVDLNLIANKINEKYEHYFGKSPQAQIRSWQNSMLYMRGVLSDTEIPHDAGVAIEFNIPTTSKRVDFILSGYSEERNDSVIIIELKQWETCNAILDKDAIIETYVGGGLREVAHPSYQAYSYASLIKSFNQTVQDDNVQLYPCAFLHNYDIVDSDPIRSNHYQEYLDKAPLFGKNDFFKLRNFIKRYIKYGDNRELLYKIENGKIKPSKMLQDAFTSVLNGNKEFKMIDEQKVIYEQALKIGKQTVKNNEKSVLIVEGGPGTGKSVLAINLLKDFLNLDMTAFYVTKNSAPRDVFKKKLKIEKMDSLSHLFLNSWTFVDSTKNQFNILIVDEAHRLNEKSGLFGNLGENQVKEVINASNFSIFFIDENQKVTLKDIGSIDTIEKYAKENNALVYKTELESQFRCNGSDGYLAWLDNLLEIRHTANFLFDFDYDFEVFDDPNKLHQAIIEKNKKNNKSRMVAGYCWNWPKKERRNSEFHDIQIVEKAYKASWNLDGNESFAIGKNSVNEIGCIHTVQGLEFDYVGVIIGDDLRYSNNQIITDYTKRAKTDQSLKGIKTLAKSNLNEANILADTIIKNTYRTLMTRGMKGCYVYCTDPELSIYLKEKLSIKD